MVEQVPTVLRRRGRAAAGKIRISGGPIVRTDPPPATRRVPPDLFQQVYDSPRSLPGQHQWVTPEADVRKVEELLAIPHRSIGAPLWLSGDSRTCSRCGRELSWLDIVSSALAAAHPRAMIARVILGDAKFVNSEVPRAIAGVTCNDCGAIITDLRSFKCHNWAYAFTELELILKDDLSHQGGGS